MYAYVFVMCVCVYTSVYVVFVCMHIMYTHTCTHDETHISVWILNIWNTSPGAIFVTRLSPRAVYFIQTKWQCLKCSMVFYTH